MVVDSSYLVISFFIYSVLGYLSEVVFCSVPKKHFVNRGFLYGPYCPIYGFGALVVIICLYPVRAHWYLVFLFAVILTSAIEYFTSWLLEKFFHMKLWDYSKHRININGRVCGLNSFLFGLMGLFATYVLEPFFFDVIHAIPKEIRSIMAYVIFIALSIDTTVSVINLKSFQRGLLEIKEKAEYIRSLDSDDLRELLGKELEKTKERREKLYAHFVNSNPSLSARSAEIREELDAFKTYLEKRAQIKREYKAALKSNRAEFVEKRNK